MSSASRLSSRCVAALGQASALGVDVLDLRGEGNLVLAAMHNGNGLIGAQQLRDERSTDEPCSAKDENPNQNAPARGIIATTRRQRTRLATQRSTISRPGAPVAEWRRTQAPSGERDSIEGGHCGRDGDDREGGAPTRRGSPLLR